MVSSFGFFTLPQLAEALLLSKSTVKRLVRTGLIAPRYQLLSGRSYRLVFEPAEALRFINEYYPTREDLALTRRPRSGRTDRLRRLINMHNVSIGRVNAMRRAKKDSLVGSESETREEEPVILDHPPRRRRNQAEMLRDYERSLGGGRADKPEDE